MQGSPWQARYRARLKADRPPKPPRRTEAEQKRLERRRQRKLDLLAGLIPTARQRKSDKALLAEGRREQRRARMAADAATEAALPAADWRVDHGDFRTWDPDPPYALRYLDLYRDLPHCAERWLGKEGWLAVMVGQLHLPKMLAALTPSGGPLRWYGHIILAHSPGRANGLQSRKINSVCKELVVLCKGKPVPAHFMVDLISYNWTPKDGDLHRWQQEVSPLQKVIRWLVRPGAMIADPMCGSGTTGVAALACNSRFLACDIDPEAVCTARHRLREVDANSDETPRLWGGVRPFTAAARRGL